jgi:hypothetical protein
MILNSTRVISAQMSSPPTQSLSRTASVNANARDTRTTTTSPVQQQRGGQQQYHYQPTTVHSYNQSHSGHIGYNRPQSAAQATAAYNYDTVSTMGLPTRILTDTRCKRTNTVNRLSTTTTACTFYLFALLGSQQSSLSSSSSSSSSRTTSTTLNSISLPT